MIKTAEKDLAILIADLLETAIKNEESGDKKINLTIMNKDGKINLEIISDKNFSEEIFLKNFMEKYTAEANETNFRKKIKFTMIWTDE